PQVTWFVDGAMVSQGTTPNGGTASFDYTPSAPGAHQVRIQVIDQSPILHPTMRAGVATTFTWTVTAVGAVTHELVVVRTGGGTGRGTSSPPGIDCGSDCVEPYTAGTIVTLSASPDAGSTFDGWSGACSGNAPCVVTMSAA